MDEKFSIVFLPGRPGVFFHNALFHCAARLERACHRINSSDGCSGFFSTGRFFPLHSGDEWRYTVANAGADESFPDVTWTVFEAVRFNGREYFAFGSDNRYPEYYCADSSGKVYKWSHGYETIWFDFTKAESDSYKVELPGENIRYLAKVLGKNETVETPAGKFTKCIHLFLFCPFAIDSDLYLWFAAGVGIVKWISALSNDMQLVSATVNGNRYPEAAEAKNRLAGFYYEKADSIAHTIFADPKLVIMVSDSADTLGTTPYWEYHFWGNHHRAKIYLATDSVAWDSTLFSLTGTAPLQPADRTVWFDSDSAMSIAEKYGGRAFRSACPDYSITCELGRDVVPFNEWFITYRSTSKPARSFYISMNARTGEVSTHWTTGINVAQAPKAFHLAQNYPNPFNGLTAIEYSLSQPGRVRLSVFNIAGQCVATLVNGLQLQGSYRSVWDASEQASGLYFYRLQMNDFVQTRKMVLAH